MPADDDKSALGSTRSTLGTDDESPGVPGFRTWRGVYWFAFGSFVVVVIALRIFTRVFA